MLRSILVPLDGSTFGEHALPLAAGLARRAGATLHLVHVHQSTPPAAIEGVTIKDALDFHFRQDEQAYLADVARRLTDVAPLTITTALLDGEVEPAIRNHASRVEADLIVMATHGRGAMGRFWLGSVADVLVRDLPRPILVVRPHNGKPDFRHEPDLSNILLPFDGSELAEQIIEPAVRLGELYGATYTLVRVIQPALRTSYLPDGTSIQALSHSLLTEIQAQQQSMHAEAQAYLDQMAQKLTQRGLKVQTRVVIDEQPAVGLLLVARTCGAGLITIETHARRGLSRMFMGSVADKLVRGGVVPVLLNRPVK